MTNESSSQCNGVSSKPVSPVGSPAPEPETLKRHRHDSCDPEDTSAAPPSKTAKMAYSIMNILAKDKKEPRANVANKENSVEAHSVSPAPADTHAQPLNPFFLNPFLAAAAAQSGQSHLLNNISNLAMLSKQQSADMWPWFNMAAMSALYGLDKGYSSGLFGSVDGSHLRNLSQSSYGHVTDNGTQLTRGKQEAYQSSSSSLSSSSAVSPSSLEQGGKKNGKELNRSVEDEEEAGNRVAFGGTSMADEDDLDDDELDEDLDGSNNGDSFDNMRKKKTRTVFSRNQVFQLESTFDMKRYLSSSERSSLANSLQLTETQIKIWFQNRRNKWKRQLAAEIEASGSNQHQQTQHQLSVTAGLNGQRSASSQRLMRVPVLYQADSQRPFVAQDAEHVQSSSSSTHSSLHSPSNSSLSNNLNPASMLSPSMLAAAAAASSLYYAAAAHAQPGTFQNFNLNIANNANSTNKQSISSVL